MSDATTIDRSVAEGWRTQARRRWAGAVPGDAPPGWSVCGVDPAVLLDAFPRLHLRADHRLAAYLYRSGGDSHTLVYGLPTGARLPPVLEPGRRPEQPLGSLPDVMDAIAGDRSAESYVQASLLARELEEFGTAGHGARWTFAFLLDDDLWDDPGEVGPARRRPSLAPQQYRWRGAIPPDFRTTATVHEHHVVVRWCTYCALDGEELAEHVDVYDRAGGYAFRRSAEALATSDRGYRI